MTFTRLRSAFVVPLFLLLAPLTSPRVGAAATWAWPSSNCFLTLQNCIDVALPGDVVEIGSHGPISETLTIQNKSLTLRPRSGFFPVLTANQSIVVIGGSSNVVVTVQGMTLTNGRFSLRQAGSGVFEVRILDNTILDDSFFLFGSAIEISGGSTQTPHGAVRFELHGNRISLSDSGQGDQKGAILVGPFLSSARGRIVGNTVTKPGGPTQSAAISIANDTTSLTVDVLHNEVRGTGFNAGISLFQYGEGRMTARVINNLVVGQVSVAGVSGGIALSSIEGKLIAQVVNNTIVGGDTGVQTSGVPNTLSGVLANNLIVGHRTFGIHIQPETQSAFVNERNLTFRNGADFFVPGPGTLFADPLFLTANDFRLRPNSPARDAGSNARVPTDITLDLGRLPRIQGAAVAMGAYEN